MAPAKKKQTELTTPPPPAPEVPSMAQVEHEIRKARMTEAGIDTLIATLPGFRTSLKTNREMLEQILAVMKDSAKKKRKGGA